jgi:cysteine desulfurase
MATALEFSYTAMPEENKRLARLASKLKSGVQDTIGDVVFSGCPDERLPGFVHTCIPGVTGESLIHNLDQVGIAAASGSACSTGSTLISHVLLAMGMPAVLAAGALRFTLGHTTNEWEIDQVLAKLPPIVERLRRIGSV